MRKVTGEGKALSRWQKFLAYCFGEVINQSRDGEGGITYFRRRCGVVEDIIFKIGRKWYITIRHLDIANIHEWGWFDNPEIVAIRLYEGGSNFVIHEQYSFAWFNGELLNQWNTTVGGINEAVASAEKLANSLAAQDQALIMHATEVTDPVRLMIKEVKEESRIREMSVQQICDYLSTEKLPIGTK